MVDPSSAIGGFIGYGLGASYEFSSRVVYGIAAGDYSELVRLLLGIVLVWFSIKVFRRAFGVIYGLIMFSVKLLLVALLAVLAVDAYQNGVEATLQAVSGFAMKAVSATINAAGPVKNLVPLGLNYYDKAQSITRDYIARNFAH